MSQKVRPGQLCDDVARRRRGFGVPKCTTQPQRHPGPTSACTTSLSAGNAAPGPLSDQPPSGHISCSGQRCDCSDLPFKKKFKIYSTILHT